MRGWGQARCVQGGSSQREFHRTSGPGAAGGRGGGQGEPQLEPRTVGRCLGGLLIVGLWGDVQRGVLTVLYPAVT